MQMYIDVDVDVLHMSCTSKQVYACICKYVCVCMYVCMYVCTYVCMHARMHAYTHARIYECIYVTSVHTYIRYGTSEYIYTCVYIHTCSFICAQTQMHDLLHTT